MFSIVLLIIHIVSVTADGYVTIHILDAIIPFIAVYKPLWLALGTLASDCLVAIIVTSLFRHKLGYHHWKHIHWLAYAAWPFALVHGIGIGSDKHQPWFIAITVCCITLFAVAVYVRTGAVESHADRMADARAVQLPYFGIALVLLALAVLIWLARLPKMSTHPHTEEEAKDTLWRHKNLVMGAVAIFVYVGAEVSIGSFLISYLASPHISHMTTADAAGYLKWYWGGAMVGRFVIGAILMRFVPPPKMLADNCIFAVALIVFSMVATGPLSMWTILLVGICNSIMFPTIFTLAIRGLGPLTGRGSGILVMAIFGGAVLPMLQGAVADSFGLVISFVIPATCYVFIWFFARNNRDEHAIPAK